MNLKADMLSDINQEIVESVEFLEEAEKESAALSFVNDDKRRTACCTGMVLWRRKLRLY